MTITASPASQISTAIASLYKQWAGRGPTNVTTVVTPRAVVVLIEDLNTPFERTLLELGETDLVHRSRVRLQLHVAERLTDIVETHTGTHVRAHVPGYSSTADAATEVFLLDADASTCIADDDVPADTSSVASSPSTPT